MSPMSATLGEFEQLVLLALMRLGPDAYGATVRREIEEHAGREVSIRRDSSARASANRRRSAAVAGGGTSSCCRSARDRCATPTERSPA